MNRQCFASKEDAVKAAIAQIEHYDLIGEKQSIEETNRRHDLRCAAAVRANQAHWDLMRKLGSQMKHKPLTPEQLSNLILHGES